VVTNQELFELFDVPWENARWQGSAESAEYLSLVTYLVDRSHKEAA
jgi:hypothetical protein